MYGVQQFGLGTEPMFPFVAEPSAVSVKDLECSASDRVVGLLDPVEDIAGGGLFDCYRRLGRLHCCCCLWAHLCSPKFGWVWQGGGRPPPRLVLRTCLRVLAV